MTKQVKSPQVTRSRKGSIMITSVSTCFRVDVLHNKVVLDGGIMSSTQNTNFSSAARDSVRALCIFSHKSRGRLTQGHRRLSLISNRALKEMSLSIIPRR